MILKLARYLLVLAIIISCKIYAVESVCYGTVADGRLEQAIKLPHSGNNFVSYSMIGDFLGRTYVHSAVRDIILNAYHKLEAERPDTVYKYAETGFREGGEFKPHKTHRNGLSVDFMVPVLNETGQSVYFPTVLSNKFGYGIEFDKSGRYKTYQIDFGSMAAHIVSLHKAAIHKGYNLKRVIFDPGLQPFLMETKYGNYLKKNIHFSISASWVRHDEHYHVDFDVPCGDQ